MSFMLVEGLYRKNTVRNEKSIEIGLYTNCNENIRTLIKKSPFN